MKTKFLLFRAFIACILACTIVCSCSSSDEDIYKGPTVTPSSNPLSSLHPSANFSWSTMDYATVTLQVNDLFNNEQDYYVHVYTVNPVTYKKASPIFSGVIRGNTPVTTAINCPSYTEKLYFKVTDPENITKAYSQDAPKAKTSVTYICNDEATIVGTTKTDVSPSTSITRVDEETIVGAYSAGYTINFEDQWPSFGDYDLNDVVLRVKDIETIQGHKNYVESATFTFELLAVGATHTLGIGLQFDEILNSSIKVITHSHRGQPGLMSTDPGAFDIHNNGDLREEGHGNELVIIPLAYDAHKVFLELENLANRSTLNTGTTRSVGREFTVSFEFNSQKVLPEHFNLTALNFFIYRVNDELAKPTERIEIHMKGYAPTRNASPHYFGTGDDDSNLSAGRYYTSANNFPWAIVVNDIENEAYNSPWIWPEESVLITKKYKRFADWVNGNGAKKWMIE